MRFERIVARCDPVEGAGGSMLGTPGPVNLNLWTAGGNGGTGPREQAFARRGLPAA